MRPHKPLPSAYLGDGEKVEVIGGADKYMAACRGCFHFRDGLQQPVLLCIVLIILLVVVEDDL